MYPSCANSAYPSPGSQTYIYIILVGYIVMAHKPVVRSPATDIIHHPKQANICSFRLRRGASRRGLPAGFAAGSGQKDTPKVPLQASYGCLLMH